MTRLKAPVSIDPMKIESTTTPGMSEVS